MHFAEIFRVGKVIHSVHLESVRCVYLKVQIVPCALYEKTQCHSLHSTCPHKLKMAVLYKNIR
jgi:hypothetical protein